MAIKIYVDILFLTNLIFDYILLCFTALFTKSFVKPLRLLLSAGAGALFAVISFFVIKSVILTFVIQLTISVIMIILAFGIRDFFGCVRLSAVLYVCTFTLGGACLALVKSNGFVMSGAAFYIDISLGKLLFAGILTYILSSISYGVVLNKRARGNAVHEVIIEHNDKKVELSGFFDTGNTIKDEYGRGVLFADKSYLQAILDKEECNFEKLIVQTVGGKTELFSFVPDKVYQKEYPNKKQPRRKVAFSNEKLSGKTMLILPSDFFDYN